MTEFLQYWPVFIWTFGLFLGSVGVAIGGTMWITGQMREQDAKRIEMKEAILKEVRERTHGLYGRMEQQHSILDEKIDQLNTRVTKIETTLEVFNRPRGRGP